MLKLEVTTPDCAEDEAFMYELALDVPWKDIMTAVSVFHPDATAVFIALKEED